MINDRSSKLVIASHNKGKISEIRMLLSNLNIEIYDAAQLGLSDPEETGDTFRENAQIKAIYAAQQSGFLSLSDDSGLVIEALGGQPGIHTARWTEISQQKRDPALGISRVLHEMTRQTNRSAKFVCVLAYAKPSGETVFFEGEVQGDILEKEQGSSGFGYDPIFRPLGHDRSFAQMSALEKKNISHRARAFMKFKSYLENIHG